MSEIKATFFAQLTEQAIDLNELLRLMHSKSIGSTEIGARIVFSGEIRGRSHGNTVTQLEYTAHKKVAEKHMNEVVQAAREKFPLIGALCVHRLGLLEVSESAVVVITLGRHRIETYAANQFIIDHVKSETPIWKREFFSDGSSVWGENCSTSEQHASHQHV